MLKALVLPVILLAMAPSVARADDTDVLCTYMRAQSHDEQIAYSFIKGLWPTMSCDLPMANDVPDLFDTPVVLHVARMILMFGEDATPESMDRSRRKMTEVAYAMSNLDRARFDKEIAKAPAPAKKLLARAFEVASAQAKEINAWRAKQTKKGAKKVWQTGWDSAIAQVKSDWSTYGADISLAMTALEKAKEEEKCPDVRTRLFDVVKKAAPKTREEIEVLMHRMDFELLLVATAKCDEDPRFAGLLWHLNQELHLRTRFEGPAAQVGSMIYGVFKELKSEQTEGIVTPSDVSGYMVDEVKMSRLEGYEPGESDGGGSGLFGQATYGEIASKKAAKQKGYTTLSFKKVQVDDYEMNCKTTNRMARINEDGNIEYFQDCKPGKSFKTTVSPSPIDVPTQLADSMKPKNFVMLAVLVKGYKGTPRIGFPIELYSDKSRKQMVGVFGARWK